MTRAGSFRSRVEPNRRRNPRQVGGVSRPMSAAQRVSALALALAVAIAALTGCDNPGPSPSSTTEPANEALVIGCGSIELAECQFVVERVLTQLPADRVVPFAVEVTLFGCNGDPNGGNDCPRSLGFRDGRVVVEYADGGEPISFNVNGPALQPGLLRVIGDSWSGLIQPRTTAEGVAGPVPFDLGHCGLSHYVDFDGSFWLPIGPYDANASGFINAESGFMGRTGADRARYQGKDGFDVQLARFPGPKHVYLCA